MKSSQHLIRCGMTGLDCVLRRSSGVGILIEVVCVFSLPAVVKLVETGRESISRFLRTCVTAYQIFQRSFELGIHLTTPRRPVMLGVSLMGWENLVDLKFIEVI